MITLVIGLKLTNDVRRQSLTITHSLTHALNVLPPHLPTPCHKFDASPAISNIMYRHLRQMNFIFHYRYATVLYYLNDVKYGGETAFPVVDEITFDKQVGLHFHLNPDLSNLSIMRSKQTSFSSPQSNTEN